MTLTWLKAAAVRAIKTAAQTAASMFTVGAALSEVSWVTIAGCAAVAGVYSMLTSLAGLPEVTE